MRSRPTCHYAYHPCDDAVLSLHEFAGKNWRLQRTQAADDGGDHRRHRRTRGAADGAARGRLLVRLAPDDRGGAAGGAAQQRHLAAGHRGGARRRRLGDRASAPGHRRAGGDGFRARPRDRRDPISARWSGSVATGRPSTIASSCFPKISTARTRGSSRTFASSEEPRMGRRAWLIGLGLYGLAAAAISPTTGVSMSAAPTGRSNMSNFPSPSRPRCSGRSILSRWRY